MELTLKIRSFIKDTIKGKEVYFYDLYDSDGVNLGISGTNLKLNSLLGDVKVKISSKDPRYDITSIVISDDGISATLKERNYEEVYEEINIFIPKTSYTLAFWDTLYRCDGVNVLIE